MKLDIDESAINKKLQILSDEVPDKSLSWLQSDTRRNVSKPPKSVQPLPGACIKTWTESSEKVFINICHSKDIHPPKDISDNELIRLLDNEDFHFIIPMAISLEKMATDKVGIERSAFDVLINTQYFKKCMKKPCFWTFTAVVILNSINNKYDKFINTSKYVVLKNCKVMGSLDTFYIEDREPRKAAIKTPLIEVLEEHENDNLQNQQKTIKTQNIKDQNYLIVKSDNGKNLICFFHLPSSNINDIIVDIGENRIVVENQKINKLIDIFIPHHVDNECSIANYDSNLNILRLTLPLKNN